MKAFSSKRGLYWAWVAALVVLTTAAYTNSFTSIFSGLDAKQSVRDNPYISRLWPLTDAMSIPLLDSTLEADAGGKGGSLARRPILSLSFAINQRVLGTAPFGYHLINLWIHLAAGILLFGLIRNTLRRGPPAPGVWPSTTSIAGAAALIWLLHPLQTESVTYIVQRAESLTGLLGLATIAAWERGTRAPSHRTFWWATAVLSCAAGMATKETMVVAPILVLLYDLTFVSRSVGESWRRHGLIHICFFATWMILGGLMVATWSDVNRDFSEGRNFEYVIRQPRVVLDYLTTSIWPRDLYVYLNTRRFDLIPAAELLISFAVVAVGIAITIRGLWRRHWSGFAGAWFFGWLAPSSSFVATSDILQEHRIYMALASPCLMLVLGFSTVCHRTLRPNVDRITWGMVVTVLCFGLGLRTWDRNFDYHDEFSPIYPADVHEAYLILATHYLGQPTMGLAVAEATGYLEHSKDPRELAFANLILAHAAVRAEDPNSAEQYFVEVLRREPEFAHGHRYFAQFLTNEERIDDAIVHLQTALRLDPTSTGLQRELGVTLTLAGRYNEARPYLERVLAERPYRAMSHNNLAYLEHRAGNWLTAEAGYRRALELDPLHLLAWVNLGDLYLDTNELVSAAETFEHIVALYPWHDYARRRLVDVYRTERNPERALIHAKALVQKNPDSSINRVTLGAALSSTGATAAAIREYEQATRLDPSNDLAYLALGTALARNGRVAEAGEALERATKLAPDNAEIFYNLGVLQAQQGANRTARSYLLQARRLDPNIQMIEYNLGLLESESGNTAKAVEHFEAQLQLTPEFQPAREQLNRLKEISAGQ